MRILCLDIPAPGASLEKYAPHLNAEALHAWGLYKSGFIRDIYFRQDRPGVAIFLECDSVDEAMNVMAEFPLAKAGLLSFECIPLGSFINWENLFAAEFKNKDHPIKGASGVPTGFFLAELTHPLKVLEDAGLKTMIA
ncbi:hypothetical protein ID866_9484, partial [Astraeus odoratus]